MHDASAADCAVICGASDVETQRKSSDRVLRWKSIPWTRVIVDTLLVAAILLASSSFLTVR
jgi:hypothetical protein